MGDDVGSRLNDQTQRIEVVLKVWNQHLDAHLRTLLLDQPYGSCEVSGASVGEVVPVHRGQHHIGEVHLGEGECHMLGFVLIENSRGPSGCDHAEPAGPAADVAHEHQGSGPSSPAFVDVRAVRLFADCVKVEVSQEPLELVVVCATRWEDGQPLWFRF